MKSSGEYRKLKDLTTKIGSGATPRGGKGSYKNNGIAFIRSQNVRNEGFTYDGIVFIDSDQAKRLGNVEVQPEDVLLNITGDSVARVCQVPDAVLPARVNQHVLIIRPKNDKLNPRFLRYFLVSPQMQAYLLQLASAGATRNALTKEMVENLDIPILPLSEQDRIGAILGSLDDKIELNHRINHTLEEIARTLFKSWFVDFDPVRAKAEGRDPGLPAEIADLFPNTFLESDIGEIPNGWTCVTLSEVFNINPPRTLRKGALSPYLDMKNMPTSGHRPLGWIDRPFGSGTRFINGDTLVARITPCLENGKTAFVDFLNDNQVGWGSTEYIVLRPKQPIPPEFAYFLARDNRFRTMAIQSMTGSSGRQRVQLASVQNFLLSLAPMPILEAFGRFVRDLLKLSKKNAEESFTLSELRDYLIPHLLTPKERN